MAKAQGDCPRTVTERANSSRRIALVRSSWYRQERHEEKAVPRLMPNRRTKNPHPSFVACVDNSGYLASLELHKIYRVIPDNDAAQDGDIRVVDESGEDYLYSADRFISIDVPKSLERSIRKAT